jgi:hypothetical protein
MTTRCWLLAVGCRLPAVVNAFVLTVPLVMTACTATVGVGVSAPVYGGWGAPYGGPYGSVGVGVGIPIW